MSVHVLSIIQRKFGGALAPKSGRVPGAFAAGRLPSTTDASWSPTSTNPSICLRRGSGARWQADGLAERLGPFGRSVCCVGPYRPSVASPHAGLLAQFTHRPKS